MDRLSNGQTSYRFFALPPGNISPVPPASASIAVGRKPIVDRRFITSVDKAALQNAPGLDRFSRSTADALTAGSLNSIAPKSSVSIQLRRVVLHCYPATIMQLKDFQPLWILEND
jgi:hypothetical protein